MDGRMDRRTGATINAVPREGRVTLRSVVC